jgi:hypothetical protein
MKKSLYLFSAALLVFVSCTNDYENSCIKKNDNNPKTDSIPDVVVGPILLKKLAHTYANGNVSTVELQYNDTKIVSDKDGSNITNYTYENDVVKKIEKSDASGVYLTNEYFYANGKLDYIFSNEFGNYYITKYVYNSDGSVFYDKLNSDSLKNDKGDTPISGRYTFSGGNLITDQYYNGSFESVTTYEYDSKNNPRVNVLGFDLLIDNNQGFAVKNNVIKKTTKNNVDPNNTLVETIVYVYEYDASGYPTKRTEVKQAGGQTTTEISIYSY